MSRYRVAFHVVCGTDATYVNCALINVIYCYSLSANMGSIFSLKLCPLYSTSFQYIKSPNLVQISVRGHTNSELLQVERPHQKCNVKSIIINSVSSLYLILTILYEMDVHTADPPVIIMYSVVCCSPCSSVTVRRCHCTVPWWRRVGDQCVLFYARLFLLALLTTIQVQFNCDTNFALFLSNDALWEHMRLHRSEKRVFHIIYIGNF